MMGDEIHDTWDCEIHRAGIQAMRQRAAELRAELCASRGLTPSQACSVGCSTCADFGPACPWDGKSCASPATTAPVAQPAGEPASMQTGSPLRAAFDVWWDGEHDWGGSTQAACMAAFKAGAAAARVPPTDSQLDRAVEAWFASDAPNGSADFEHDSDARFRARMRAAIEAAGQEGGAA